jgi:hypothetical protein
MGSVRPSGSRDLPLPQWRTASHYSSSSEGHERSGGGQGFNQNQSSRVPHEGPTNSVNSDPVVGKKSDRPGFGVGGGATSGPGYQAPTLMQLKEESWSVQSIQ